MRISTYKVPSTKSIRLKDYPTTENKKKENEHIRDEIIPDLVKQMKSLHHRLHAEEKHGILVVLQAMDAAGKDEAISYIFSNLSAQGLKTTTLGKPSEDEKAKDYLRRIQEGLPSRGEIGILNRSHYEEVIAPRIHDLLEEGDIPSHADKRSIWKMRYRQINDYEKYLYENGIHIVKFFFHMSKDEQKDRLLERMKNPEKHWEFSFADVEEREHWDKYHKIFEEMLSHTSTSYCPWYVLPADDEWHSRRLVTEIMIQLMEKLDPKYPTFTGEDLKRLKTEIKKLESE